MGKKVLKKSVFAAMFILLLAGCSKTTDNQADLQNLKQAMKTFYAAVESGDDETRYALFDDGAMMLSNHGSLTVLTDSVKNAWVEGGKDWVFRLKDIEHREIAVSGDMGYSVNTYYYTWHRKGEDPLWHKTKNVHIWRRQKDNTWKLHIDIWNASE